MAYTLTIDDVRAICPSAKNEAVAPDDTISMYIDVVSQADECLDANGVNDTMQKFLKGSAVSHYLTKSLGGTIKSESDFDGASVSFDNYQADGYGLASTLYGQNILSSPYSGCFAFMDVKPSRFIVSAGR